MSISTLSTTHTPLRLNTNNSTIDRNRGVLRMEENYPRHLILGTVEHEQYLTDAYYSGWIAPPSIIQTVKQKLCRHKFSLWCTNYGVQDAVLVNQRICAKCGKEEFHNPPK